MESLVNAEESSPATWLNDQGFTNIQDDEYWSSTTFAQDTSGRGWVVYMDAGGIGRGSKVLSHRVIAVRDVSSGIISLQKSGQTTQYAAGDDGDLEMGIDWPEPRFVDNGNDTITDNLTGLMWEKSPYYTRRNWTDALSHANNLELGGYIDWRLPNRLELRSLVNYGRSNSGSWLRGQGFSSIQYDFYWTSTTYGTNTLQAWNVLMDDGNVYYHGKSTTSNYVWAVRGG